MGIGLALGLLLSRPTLRFRAFYRVLLIVPWAVPSYVTALAWKGMFHRQFGAVNGLLLGINDVLGADLEPIAWFSHFSTAFTANVATNVWLGFPFMMVVTLGALTADPRRRARGGRGRRRHALAAASARHAARCCAPTLGPAVMLGAIWTFNMFNVVFLVSGGEPDGTTDILVTEAYRWAFTRETQYGYAAAYAVLISSCSSASPASRAESPTSPKSASTSRPVPAPERRSPPVRSSSAPAQKLAGHATG